MPYADQQLVLYHHTHTTDLKTFYARYADILPNARVLIQKTSISQYMLPIHRGFLDQLSAEAYMHQDEHLKLMNAQPYFFLKALLFMLRSSLLVGQEYEGVKKNINAYWRWVEKSAVIRKGNQSLYYAVYFYVKSFCEEKAVHPCWLELLEAQFTAEQLDKCQTDCLYLLEHLRNQQQYEAVCHQIMDQLQIFPFNVETIETYEKQRVPETHFDASDFLNLSKKMKQISGQSYVQPASIIEKIYRQKPYSIFTKKFDEIRSIYPSNELTHLNKIYQEKTEEYRPKLIKNATKLQQLLLSIEQQKSRNDEQGRLHPKYLVQSALNPIQDYPKLNMHNQQSMNTHVSLLIDHSGSMIGKPILLSMLTAELFAKLCARFSISTEILGFTTKSWHGGESYQEWQNSKQSEAGRLNDLLHIIYKPYHQPLRSTLGYCQKPGLLKENIDGEALLWAKRRLHKIQAQRKILIVISDGAPVDDITLSHTHPDFLSDHLQSVIHEIESRSETELYAIGIGDAVQSFYKRSVIIDNFDRFSEQFFQMMLDLFGD